MNFFVLRSNVLAGALLLTYCTGFAVTLGPVRGAALIGRPLDLTVPAKLAPGDDPSALCIEVDLAYSDARIDPKKVTVRSSATEPGQAVIRLTSSTVVDEPVVSLNIQAGCSVKNSRRYVLLADLPVDALQRPFSSGPASAPVVGDGTAGTAPSGSGRSQNAEQDGSSGSGQVVPGLSQSPPGSRSSSAPPRRPGTAPSGNPSVSRSVQGNTSRPAGGGALAQSLRLGESAPRGPGAPRLRLDSAELSAEVVPSLKSSAELQALPAESDSRRSEFAALWRALNLRPEDVSRDMQRLDEVQSQARALREANTKNQAEIGLTREQLKKAESERYANPVVYGLLALLAAFLLAFGFLFYRTRRSTHVSRDTRVWWNLRDDDQVDPADAGRSRAPAELRTQDRPVSRSVVLPDDRRAASALEEKFQSGFRAAESSFPASGISATPRGVNVNELFDIAQQADFFVSLGQHDHAIEVLSNHIRENKQTSPLAYLDLFKLYHELDRKAQYDELRLEFNRIFNAEVPPFEAFRQRGEGLEVYENALSRIQSLWNTPKVLEVIEESIFRKPGRTADAFGLEAYRELLLLYAIANELVDASDAAEPDVGVADGSFGRASAAAWGTDATADYSYTELQPLGTSMVGNGTREQSPVTIPAEFGPSRGGSLGLDIDLSEPLDDSDYDRSDDTIVLPNRKSGAFEPASSAWLDFDLTDAGSDDGQPGRLGKDSGKSPHNK